MGLLFAGLASVLFVTLDVLRKVLGHPTANHQQARLTGWGARALAANQNSFEITPIFAVAVITAHLFQADPWWSAMLAALFVVSRVLYIILYLRDVNLLRSTVWTVGLVCCIALFVLAM